MDDLRDRGFVRGGGGIVADNDAAKVGVPLYYRAVVHADTPIASPVVPFTRFRRLERDPANETGGLADCVQIFEQYTNGQKTEAVMPQAFDGDLDTTSDGTLIVDGQGGVDRAKVGIDFGEAGVFFVGGRVYPRKSFIARSNGAYFSAANEESFADAVTMSGAANFNSQYDWRFLPSMDTMHPYRYVWIWKPTGNWYASMAEVQLYGWTQQDIDDAGVVLPPQEVTLTRGTATGTVIVGWSGGANIESLAIERRVVGTDAWTTVESGLPATETSWTDTLPVTDVSYEYRIVATGVGGDSAATALVLLYKVGDGTGLRAVLHGPIASPSYPNMSAGQCVYREFRNDATIDIDTSLQALYAQTNIASALVHWRGKLIVPETGDYTFGLEVKGYDGYSIWVDDEEVANHNYNSQTQKEQVSLTLTAGEHPIRIEWASRAYGDVRFCRLTWALKDRFPEEVIPMSQLKPETDDAAFPCYMVDGYNFALPLDYDADIYLPRMERTANGDYTIYCQGWPRYETEPDIGMTVKGPFRAEVTLNAADSTAMPSSQLVVRRVSDGRAMIGFISQAGTGKVCVMASTSELKARSGTSWIDCKSPVRLRIDRDKDKTLHLYYQGDGQTQWTEFFTFIEGTHYMKDGVMVTDCATFTDDSLRVSFGACGGSADRIICHSHGFKVKPRLTGLMLVVE